MITPTFKELLMLANNAGMSIKIQLGTYMDIPCLQIDVEKGFGDVMYGDGRPVNVVGNYKRAQTYIPLFQIPYHQDSIVDFLMQIDIIRELVEEKK